MEEEKTTTKEDAGGGVIIASFFVTIIILGLFLWTPIAHYHGKWNDFWDNKDRKGSVTFNFEPRPAAEIAAEDECDKQADKAFEIKWYSAFASSTSDNYATYDCWAIKFTQVK